MKTFWQFLATLFKVLGGLVIFTISVYVIQYREEGMLVSLKTTQWAVCAGLIFSVLIYEPIKRFFTILNKK